MNKDWFWPDNILGRIISIITFFLLAIRFIPGLEEISFYGSSIFIIFISAISIITFYIYLLLNESNKTEIAELLTVPFIGNLLIFMGLYWIFDITSSISSQIIISRTAIFFFILNQLVVGGVSLFSSIKKISKYTSELPIGIEKSIPKHKTVPLLSGSIASLLIYVPILYIAFLLIMIIKSGYDIFLLFQMIGLLVFTLFTIILLLKRFETIFWIETICLILSTATFMYFGHQALFVLIMFTYAFVLFGISLLYNLNSIKSNFIIAGFIILPNVIICIILLNDFFPNTLTSIIITGIIVPFTSAIVGAHYANSLSKKENSSDYITASEASYEFKLSKDKIYKLIRNGKLRAKKKGRQWIIVRKDLNEISVTKSNFL